MLHRKTLTKLTTFIFVSLIAPAAFATTYPVGPSKANKTLQDVQGKLKPGDVVEIDGDATYPGGVYIRAAQNGTAAAKVTIKGIKVNGKRPIISGGGTGVLDGLGMVLNGSHYVFESLEVTASSDTCIVHKGDDITIRDFVVHDCPGQGLLGHDDEAGSLTLENSEFFKNGNGTYEHQIYMTTGQEMYPGAVFRMQNCYVHDGNGGNNIKTRSERNEIYYNWIEGAFYHNLEMIGADKSPATPAREDSDVVGNVIVGGGAEHWHLIRVGGDKDEADTKGRYRFVNNTFVVPAAGADSIVRVMLRVDTVEMHNNAFIRMGAGTAPIFDMSEVQWVSGAASIFGSNNWVQDGYKNTPATWTGTIAGADPGVMDLAKLDLRLKDGSVLLDKGVTNPPSVAGREFPKPLTIPGFVPPARQIAATLAARPPGGAIDIGAFEIGTGVPPGQGGPGPSSSSGDPAQSSNGGPAGSNGGTTPGGENAGPGAAAEDEGCGCGVIGVRAPTFAALGIAAAVGAIVVVRRRRRAQR